MPGGDKGAQPALAYQYYQGGPVSCTIIFLTTLVNEMCMTQLVKAKSLAAYSSCAVGHSQGLASAACLSFVRFAIKAVWAVFRQGLYEQQASGLRHMSLDNNAQLKQSSMFALRGRPNAYLQYSCLRSAANIINSESSVVCSGRPAFQLASKLKDTKGWPGVEGRPLPVPFASHSLEMTPTMFRILEDMRCRGFPGRGVEAKLRIYPFPTGLNPRRRKPLDLWRVVLAKQLTTFMDYPSIVEEAAAGSNVTHVIDFGPTDNSISSRLLAGSGNSFPIVAAVAYPGKTRPLPTNAVLESAASSLLPRILAVAVDVLGIPSIAPDASLKQAGATSQHLGALRSRLLEAIPECHGNLPAAKFFSAPTMRAIAFLTQEGRASSPDSRTARQPLPPIVHTSIYSNKGTLYPLSFGQEQMLRLQTVNPTCVAYNVSASVWIAGGVDPERVKACVQAIVSRHEVFSGLAVHSPQGLRLLAASPAVNVVRVSDEAAALSRMGEVGRVPFLLSEEASLRAEVLVAPSGLVLLALWVHHMNFDILSQGVFHGELLALLSSRGPSLERAAARLPELPVQYVDFSLWSRRCVAEGHVRAEALLGELAAHVPRGLDLPLDRPRPRHWTFQGDRVAALLPRGPRPPGGDATPFVAYLAAFFIQLWKCSGQEAVIVGVPYHGRDLSCLQPLCGYFINMLPVLGEATSQTTVAGALAQTRERWQHAMDHAAVPFLHLVDSLNKQHLQPDPSRNPVFQAMLNYRAETLKPLGDERFRVQQVHQLEGHMDLDLQIDSAGGSGVIVTLNYCTSLFEARTAERFAAQYLAALRALSLEAWSRVQAWRLPGAPRLLEDVQEAKPISLEYSAQKLTPLLAEMHEPVLVGGPSGLQVLP